MDSPPEIYIKESVLKQIESGTPHRTLKVVFADNAHMPNSKGKTKQCIIVVNLAGIYFLRSKGVRHNLEVKTFISTYDISEIKYVDSKKREIIHNKHKIANPSSKKAPPNTYFISEHAESAVTKILSARKLLIEKDLHPVKLSNFPTPPMISSLSSAGDGAFVGGESLAVIRHVCLSLRLRYQPSQTFIGLLNTIDPNHPNQTVTFDETVSGVRDLTSLGIPVSLIPNVTTVHFKKFTPFAVCRLAHLLLKNSNSIKTLIFENYSNFVPTQLKMGSESLKNKKSPISFVFTRCILPDETITSLFHELAEYKGEFQRLSFNYIQLSANSCSSLFENIRKSRSFRTLEVFELNNVDSKSISGEKITAGIDSLIRHCRFLNYVSVSNWTEQFQIPLETFMNHGVLGEIVLQKQDMSQPFPENFRIHGHVHYLDFSRCSFTFISLQSLFRVISQCTSPLSLSLADISLPEAHWRSLFESLPTMTPISCLRSLDWSGNKIAYQSMQQFADFFVEKNPLKYLAINRVFGSSQIEDLKVLFSYLPKNKISGLSIGGDNEKNFSGSFQQFLSALDSISPLTMLNVDGQKMSDDDFTSFLEFVKNNSSLCEISCDDSQISSDAKFFEIYGELLHSQTISTIGRPMKDIQKLFGRNIQSLIMQPNWVDFAESMINTHPKYSSDSARSFFLCRVCPQESINTAQYLEFMSAYPPVYFSLNEIEMLRLNYNPKSEHFLVSIFQLLTSQSEAFIKLAIIHAKLLRDPLKSPNFGGAIPQNMTLDFGSSTSNSQVTNNQNNNYVSSTQIENSAPGNTFGNEFENAFDQPYNAFGMDTLSGRGAGQFGNFGGGNAFEQLQPFDGFGNENADKMNTDGLQQLSAFDQYDNSFAQPLQPLDDNAFSQPLQPLDDNAFSQPLQPLDINGDVSINNNDSSNIFGQPLEPLQPLQPLHSLGGFDQPLEPLEILKPLEVDFEHPLDEGFGQPLQPLQPFGGGFDQPLQPLGSLQPIGGGFDQPLQPLFGEHEASSTTVEQREVRIEESICIPPPTADNSPTSLSGATTTTTTTVTTTTTSTNNVNNLSPLNTAMGTNSLLLPPPPLTASSATQSHLRMPPRLASAQNILPPPQQQQQQMPPSLFATLPPRLTSAPPPLTPQLPPPLAATPMVPPPLTPQMPPPLQQQKPEVIPPPIVIKPPSSPIMQQTSAQEVAPEFPQMDDIPPPPPNEELQTTDEWGNPQDGPALPPILDSLPIADNSNFSPIIDASPPSSILFEDQSILTPSPLQNSSAAPISLPPPLSSSYATIPPPQLHAQGPPFGQHAPPPLLSGTHAPPPLVSHFPPPLGQAPPPLGQAPPPLGQAPSPIVQAPPPIVQAPPPVVQAPPPKLEAPQMKLEDKQQHQVLTGSPVNVLVQKSQKKVMMIGSAAGELLLPSIKTAGPNFLPAPAQPSTVKLSGNQTDSIPQPTELALIPSCDAVPLGEQCEIEDVATFSKNAVRSIAPPVEVIRSSADSLDSFYNGTSPCNIPPPQKPTSVAPMSHPLQSRKRIPPPRVAICGIPSEW